MARQIEETWSTHQMRLNLSNLEDLYRVGRAFATEDPTGENLRDWISSWFWDGYQIPGSTRDAMLWLRDNMTRREWDEIDWESVAEDLGTE